jgi:hypothetical protein
VSRTLASFLKIGHVCTAVKCNVLVFVMCANVWPLCANVWPLCANVRLCIQINIRVCVCVCLCNNNKYIHVCVYPLI